MPGLLRRKCQLKESTVKDQSYLHLGNSDHRFPTKNITKFTECSLKLDP